MRSKGLFEQLPPERVLPAESKRRLKEELMSTITEQTTTTGQQVRPKRYRRTVVLAAAALAVASVGTAWALTTTDPEQTTRIQCPGDTIIAAVSGDPVIDCENALREQGLEPPVMTAYVTEGGGVVVVFEGDDIAPAWEPLPTDFQQDTSIIELEAALGDVTTGLEGDCYNNDEAVAIVERELERFGFEWSVETRDDPDGVNSCAAAFLEPERQAVTVFGLDDVHRTGDEPWVVFGGQLQDALEAECLNLGDAAETAVRVAGESGIDPAGVRVTATLDGAASCTRATVNVGGLIFVDLRGPQD